MTLEINLLTSTPFLTVSTSGQLLRFTVISQLQENMAEQSLSPDCSVQSKAHLFLDIIASVMISSSVE